MICSICGQQTQSAEDHFAGGWRAVDADGYRVYACHICTPRQEESAHVWEKFYMGLGEMLAAMCGGQMSEMLIWLEKDDGSAERIQGQDDATKRYYKP